MEMQDWKSIVSAKRMGIPDTDLDGIVSVLESLETAFRPLVATIPRDVEPGVILSEPSVQGE